MHRRRRERVFPRAGDQRHPRDGMAQVRHIADPRPLRRAEHLEAELRHPVAIGAKRQVLENHIGKAPIGGRHPRPLDCLDLRIGKLIRGARIDAHRHSAQRDLGPVGPDPPDPRDLAFAKRDGKADRIAVFRDLGLFRRTLATAAADRGAVQKARRPDDLARDPHPAPDLPDGRTLAGAGQAKAVDLARLYRARTAAHQALVDDPANGRAHGTADHRAGEAKDRAAEPRTNRGTDS